MRTREMLVRVSAKAMAKACALRGVFAHPVVSTMYLLALCSSLQLVIDYGLVATIIVGQVGLMVWKMHTWVVRDSEYDRI